MNCREYRERLFEHHRTPLSAREAEELRKHANECAACTAHLRDGTRVTCREVADFLAAFLDEEMPTAQRRIFEAHLAICPACVDYLESYKETIRLSKTLCDDPGLPAPPEVPEDLIRGILLARRLGERE